MKRRKPILCVWLPRASAETVNKVDANLNRKLADEYHVIIISENSSAANTKIELLGTRKLSKTKFQTILNAMNKWKP